jgi:hypothetical protein
MTDVLCLFSQSKFKKNGFQMIEDKQRPIDGGGVHLASRTDHF